MSNYGRKLARLALLLLALVRGEMYASYLPPWGLIDEEQHVHYIQHLVEQRSFPIVGQTYLSSEIIESAFDTHRWETFHWPTPTSHIPQEMGLEGHSYEGYQPPVFYMLLVPLYVVLPDNLLVKLYCLRWAVVGLSLLTVWMISRIVTELFPQYPALPYFVSLLLIFLPERTASVSRVNNDVLLEVIATAFVWVSTRTILSGLSIRRSQLLGLILGFGVLTKTSMIVLLVLLLFIFWINRKVVNYWLCAMWTGGIALVLIIPFVARNLWLYGGVTGFSGFRVLSRDLIALSSPALTLQNIFLAVRDLFCHFWVVWWKGARVITNPVLNGTYIVLAILSGYSFFGIVHNIWGQHRCKLKNGKVRATLVMYLLAAGSCAIAVLIGYFSGIFFVIQGRFFLPVVVPILVLYSWGMWHNKYGRGLVLITLGILVVLDTLSLFGNLLPYFYYWSAFVKDGVHQSYTSLTWREAWSLFYPRFLNDKPTGMWHVLIGILPLYLMSLSVTGLTLIKKMKLHRFISESV
jgi:hypothetical protein